MEIKQSIFVKQLYFRSHHIFTVFHLLGFCEYNVLGELQINTDSLQVILKKLNLRKKIRTNYQLLINECEHFL